MNCKGEDPEASKEVPCSWSGLTKRGILEVWQRGRQAPDHRFISRTWQVGFPGNRKPEVWQALGPLRHERENNQDWSEGQLELWCGPTVSQLTTRGALGLEQPFGAVPRCVRTIGNLYCPNRSVIACGPPGRDGTAARINPWRGWQLRGKVTHIKNHCFSLIWIICLKAKVHPIWSWPNCSRFFFLVVGWELGFN